MNIFQLIAYLKCEIFHPSITLAVFDASLLAKLNKKIQNCMNLTKVAIKKQSCKFIQICKELLCRLQIDKGHADAN